MKNFNFSGSYFKVGVQKGKIYRRCWLKNLNFPINHEHLKKQKAIYEKFYPEYFEELKGIAFVTKSSIEQIENFFLVKDVLDLPQKGCTIFGIKNSNGILIGKNYDWRAAAEKFMCYFLAKIEKKNKYVGITDRDTMPLANFNGKIHTFEAEDAINEHGLYIGLTAAHHPSRGFGLGSIGIIRWVAENCSSTKEALQFLKRVEIANPKNFFIADLSGDMAVFEQAGGKKKIIMPEKDFLVKTNHFLDDELALEEIKQNIGNSVSRFSAVQEVLKKSSGRQTQDSLIKILRNDKVCANDIKTKWKTIWQLALNMRDKKYFLFHGKHKINLRI